MFSYFTVAAIAVFTKVKGLILYLLLLQMLDVFQVLTDFLLMIQSGMLKIKAWAVK